MQEESNPSKEESTNNTDKDIINSPSLPQQNIESSATQSSMISPDETNEEKETNVDDTHQETEIQEGTLLSHFQSDTLEQWITSPSSDIPTIEESDQNFKRSIASALRYFEFIDLEIDHIEEGENYWLLFSKIDTTIGTLRLAISLQPHQIIAYAFHPLIVIEPIRPLAMEFVTRANFGLPYGKFELDLDHGDLRFATGYQQSEFTNQNSLDGFSEQHIGELLDNSIGTLTYYHSALIETLYNNVPPKDAIAQIENS